MVKEVIIGSIMCIVVLLLLGIVFYEFIPTKMTPQTVSYEQSKTTTKLLSQIQEEIEDEANPSKSEESLKSYDVSEGTLETALANKDYVQGKNHPFNDYTKLTTQASGAAVDPDKSKTGEDGDDDDDKKTTDPSKPIDSSKYKDTTDKTKVSK